ncbi:MAG: diacylglycerol kinase family protein [Anaerolineae bacterium]|nr:diacylglycerol kinase family protein [Anaerolineae bacterium]
MHSDEQPDWQEVDRNAYRPLVNPNRASSFRYSLAGLWYMVSREQSIQILSIYTVIVILLALWLAVDALTFVVLMLPIGFTWVVECLNTAIEAAVDLAMPELHPLAKIAKDVSSTATFLSASLSVVATLLLLGPLLFSRLAG